jgi:hypothetical protein
MLFLDSNMRKKKEALAVAEEAVEVAEAEEALMRMDALKLRTVRGWTSTSTSPRSIT